MRWCSSSRRGIRQVLCSGRPSQPASGCSQPRAMTGPRQNDRTRHPPSAAARQYSTISILPWPCSDGCDRPDRTDPIRVGQERDPSGLRGAAPQVPRAYGGIVRGTRRPRLVRWSHSAATQPQSRHNLDDAARRLQALLFFRPGEPRPGPGRSGHGALPPPVYDPRPADRWMHALPSIGSSERCRKGLRHRS